MKKILAIFVMVLFAAYPAVSQAAKGGHGAPVEISGVMVLQHVIGDDYAGGNNTDAYKIYLNFDKQITSGIKAHVTVNTDQFGSQGDNNYLYARTAIAPDSDALEEAYLLFTGVAGHDISLIFGKMEAPFGQDCSQFITSTYTHTLEVDKVWGAGVVFGLGGFGSITAAVAIPATRENRDIGLTDTRALKIKADKLLDGLSLEASRIVLARDSSFGETDDMVQTSLAGKYTIGDFTIALEQSKVENYAYSASGLLNTVKVLLLGADYRIGKVLLKANYETFDNNYPETAYPHFALDALTMYGANYELADGVYATVEASTKEFIYSDDDVYQLLLGLYANF